MTKAEAHAYDCEWHLDQYDWECTCGAVPNPEEIKPEWLKAPGGPDRRKSKKEER